MSAEESMFTDDRGTNAFGGDTSWGMTSRRRPAVTTATILPLPRMSTRRHPTWLLRLR